MSSECEYCSQWNREHPQEAPRTSCGPCDFCQATGHIGAHPRQSTSICLCEKHWAELTAPGYHFELYHLIYLALGAIIVATVYPMIARFF
jgi:hypothetical protein